MSPYRHTLTRHLTAETPRRWLGVVMVNPSMASEVFVSDKESNDNTIRSLLRSPSTTGSTRSRSLTSRRIGRPTRCELLAALEAGFDILDHQENDAALAALARRCEAVVCAWGATPLKHPALARRASEVRALLLGHLPLLHCFGKTKDGWPKHPLYLPRATSLVPFASRGAA